MNIVTLLYSVSWLSGFIFFWILVAFKTTIKRILKLERTFESVSNQIIIHLKKESLVEIILVKCRFDWAGFSFRCTTAYFSVDL